MTEEKAVEETQEEQKTATVEEVAKTKTEEATGEQISDDPVVVSKEDLELIVKKQNEIQNGYATIGLLELRKAEVAGQVSAARRAYELSVHDTLLKLGIPEEEVQEYGINPRTGQVLKRQLQPGAGTVPISQPQK